MWKAWSSTIGRPPNSRAARTTKKMGDGPSCSAAMTARSERCTRGMSSWPPESAVFRAFRIFRRCATSAALFCTPANTTTARCGGAKKSWSSARAIAAMILRQDLHSSGARVTLVQRSSTMIVNVEPSAQLPYSLYDEGPSLEDCDLITTSMPLSVAKRSHILLTQQAKKLDKDLLDGLERKGFKLDFGEDGTG